MRTTIFGVISLSFFILALTSCGGGQSPSPSPDDATVSLYPARVVMAPGEALTFRAVPSDGNGSALSWEASQGTLVANGVTANYTAPNTPGSYEVRVIPNANPAGVVTSEITVAMLESETSGTLTSAGGEVAAEGDSIVRVGSGVLSRDAEVRLRAYSGVVREPGEGLVGVGPLREFLFPATAFVNARALPAEAPNGGGGQDDPFDGRILLRVPFPDGLPEDGTYFLEVTIDAGGELFTYPEPYYPGGTGVIEIGTGLLAAIREGLGGWENVSISTQLVQGDLYLSSAANVPLKGLYAVTDAFTLNSGLAQACPGNANQSLPSGIVRAGAQHLDGRTPLVLITGWQTLANMAAGAKSLFSSKTYVPQVCGWSEFLSTMLLENNVFFDDPGELRRQYSIFTFGYDSDLSIATNGLALRNALQTYFGDREIVILAHSMGGLLTNYAVNAGGLNNVAHAITLGTPFRGTSLIHCVKAVDGNCTEVILNPRVKDELDQSCKDSGIPAVVCWASFKDLQQMITGLASRQGDRDLAWQYGGAHNYWVYPLCEGSLRLCAVSIETEPNPRLEQLNYRLNTSSVSRFTAYIGNISPSNPSALFGAIASFLLLADGHASDGIVPVASACLSTGRVDNSCANGLIRTVVPKGLTHTELSGSPNYFDVRQHLLSLLPDTEPPTEEPEEAPRAFTLQPAVAFCTPASQPAVRLTWSASSGAVAYEIHRNGSLYAEPQSLSTTFENTANVVAGTTYTYFVRARNAVGATDSNSRTITVPANVCAADPGEPATFTLHPAEPFCTWDLTPAIRLRWDPVPGVQSYEMHRNGALYFALETLGTTFENTANVVPGGTYTYLVRARTASGVIDSNTVVGVAAICDGQTEPGAGSRLATGYHYSLAVGGDGTVWAWGRNETGELGDGTTTDRHSPVRVTGLSRISSVAAGHSHSLALTEGGRVWAWGNGYRGNLGTGERLDETTPVLVEGVTNVVDIAAGNAYSLALDASGSVWHWGISVDWEMSTDQLTPARVGGLPSIGSIAAGNVHAVALGLDGTVWTWGWNQFGQLGDGSTETNATPQRVSGLSNVASISAGEYTSFAILQDGTVWTWGVLNGSGEVSLTPTRLGGITNIQQLSSSDYHRLAVRLDGTVWAWGSNYYGELGNGETGAGTAPTQVGGLPRALEVAAGINRSFALAADGSIWGWGENHYGQLGDGTTTNRLTPVRISGIP